MVVHDNVTVGFEKHLLGRYLQQLREKAGLTLAEAGERWDFNKNKVDSWERGHWVRAKEVDLLKLLSLYGVDVEDEAQTALYLDLLRAAKTPAWYKPYVRSLDGAFPALEGSAAAISSYQQTIIPGQLQTPGYVRALGTIMLQEHTAEEGQDTFAEFREERQRRLFERGTTMTFVVQEAAIHRARSLGREVWEEQATRIWEVVNAHPQVTFRVLPEGKAFTHAGSFLVWDFLDPATYSIAYSEAGLVPQYVDDPGRVSYTKSVFRWLGQHALPAEASMDIVIEGVST